MQRPSGCRGCWITTLLSIIGPERKTYRITHHDTLSHELRTAKEEKRYMNCVVICNMPNAVTKEQVQKATDGLT